MTETVNHPSHYNHGGLEAIDILKDQLTVEEFRGFCKGSAPKYLLRAGYKESSVDDYVKTRWKNRKDPNGDD